ncbi:MAG: hypothetical protein AB1445_10515, partial [Bacillota bacterium]
MGLPEIPSPGPPQKPPSALQAEVPLGRYDWDEGRPGALEIDLVEHNGGSSQGHYAYTLNVVDAVSGYSRRRAVLGRVQAGIFRELADILKQWPFRPWGLHADNGSEFLNNHLIRFTKKTGLEFHRSRPYRKNDNAHVEQKNRRLVREVVGYERFDTVAQVDWLNRVYTGLVSLTRFGGHPILETGEVANAGNKTTISAGVPGGSCPLGTREW